MILHRHTIFVCLSVAIAVVPALTPGFAYEGVQEDDLMALRALLGPVPLPEMVDFDEPVAKQLRLKRSEMEKVLADPLATAGQLAAAYGALGRQYHAYELFDAAQGCYENARAMQPDEYSWYHLLGDVHRREGRMEEAIVQFEGALSLKPDDFAAIVYLGNCHFELSNDSRAEAWYGRAMALYPGSPSVMAGLGRLALRRQEYEEAIVFFKAALAAVPDANRLHYSLAMAYRGAGQMDKARHHLEQRGTVGLRPPDPLIEQLRVMAGGERVSLVRGRLAFAAERYEEARRDFELAVAADPSSVRALVNLGTTLSALGDRDGAMARFEAALKLDETNRTAHFNLASLLAQQGDHQAALVHLRQVVADGPEDGEAQLLLARTLVELGDDQGSLAHFEQSAKLDPGNESSVIEGAAALVRLGLYFRSKRVLEAGAERMPESGWIAFALARLLAACPDEAVRDGKRALEIALLVFEADSSPRHAQVVAQALAELGRCEEAAEWQEKLIESARRDGVDDASGVLKTDLERYQGGAPCRPPITENPV